ncbi:hypothetical protein SAM23877_5276 [Streptomyces ambofaciens ATCC 23877]|uniref:Uncharacterized protein n=1 Tax=Streptomyces ambofaciens (strain ATCC 23877 / 3486 / DSM 40053 / JCM 4204 / NBRC 12836 / NRRL B-2516) TaxID=278992 RepID=A0A0K2AZI4_STRA7|nr:hypothetical protein SAM23877_5276 [Streptomyces ambofaciens ATCC 23877]
MTPDSGVRQRFRCMYWAFRVLL